MTILLIVLFAVALAGGGSVAVSQNSLPGDFLYPVKVEVEYFRLLVSPDDGDADLYLIFAAERIEEMNSLLEKGRISDSWIASERLAQQLEALLIITGGSGTMEQITAYLQISESFITVVEQILASEDVEEMAPEFLAALLTSQAQINDLFTYGHLPSQNQTFVMGLPSEAGLNEDDENSDFTPTPAEFHPTASLTAVSPTTNVVTTSAVVFATVQMWPTATWQYYPATQVAPPAATATNYNLPASTAIPTAQPTTTNAGYPAPPQPTATNAGYPAPPQPTATNAGYPAPPLPTAQPTATNAGYPAPPLPTTQPTTQATPTLAPTPTQGSYPPPAYP